ncbi:MAG: hypothetical protein QXO12_02180 [Candidatus Pacearchaeota archaeon]
MKERLIKKAFNNILCGSYLIIKDKNNPNLGALFEDYEGRIIYKGIIEKNNKHFIYHFPMIEVSIKSKREILASNQILPTEIASYFYPLFRLSPYNQKKELENKIKEIEIKYLIK